MKSRMADGFFLDIELCRDAVNTHCPAIYRNAVPAYSPGLPLFAATLGDDPDERGIYPKGVAAISRAIPDLAATLIASKAFDGGVLTHGCSANGTSR